MSTINYDIAMSCVPHLTEDEALDVYHVLRRRFGWAGTFFTRADAEQEWQNQQYDDTTGQTPTTALSDEVWTAIQSTWAWRKGLTDSLTEHGWTLVSDAVTDATHKEPTI